MKTGVYCTGLHGRLFYNVLKTCGISVDWVSDGNPDSWGTEFIDGLITISPKALNPNDYSGFICVGRKNYLEVYDFVTKNNLFQVVPISSLIDRLIKKDQHMYFKLIREHAKNEPADLFYDITPNKNTNSGGRVHDFGKVAVYTAVFGNYDNEYNLDVRDKRATFFYISDEKPEKLPQGMIWIDAKRIIPSSIKTPIKRNRYVKMNPHKIFRDYQYSIYVDGNVKICGDIFELVRDSKSGISVFSHPMRECIYYEALSICNFKRVNVDDVCNQMERYFEEGMPMRYGLMEMPIISREHNKPACIKVMETWWEEFNRGAQRDQLSFMYAIWKNGMTIQDVACLGNDVRNDDRVMFYKHAYESKNVKNDMCQTIGI